LANELVVPERKLKPYEAAIYDQRVQNAFRKHFGDDTFAYELIHAKQAIEANSKLAGCPTGSITDSVMNVLLCGTTLNPAMKEAYLVPRKGKCVLELSYRGLIRIACSDGNVKFMNAAVVFDWDMVNNGFEYRMGTDPYLKHIQNFAPEIDPSTLNGTNIWEHVVCAYSMATYVDGSTDFVVLPKWKLYKAYQASEGKNAGMPWDKWPEEQIRKTVLKYHTKTLRGDNPKLRQAVAISDEFDFENSIPEAPAPAGLNDIFNDDVIDIKEL
jgi:recombination protein RecT